MLKFSLKEVDSRDVMDLARLIRILETEERGYSALEELENSKREALVSGSAADIEEILRHQETLVNDLRRLEFQRREFLELWHRESGGSVAPTLEDIINVAGEPKATRIRELREQLKALVGSLGGCVRNNEVLVNQSLDHVSRLVSILTGTHTSLAYEHGGRRSALGTRQILNRNV